ncbi:MAG: hypothetical protein JW940_19915 [Polyangiaceae bacterium]|nr:hypothetical protein [Polyangiaceae bacterium]
MPTTDPDVLARVIAAVTSPLQLAALAIAAAVAVVFHLRSGRYALLLRKISDLPEADREKALRTEMQVPTPPDMTAEQYLAHRQQRYRFWTRIVLVLGLLVIVLLAVVLPKAPKGSGSILFRGCNSGTVIINNPALPNPGGGNTGAR